MSRMAIVSTDPERARSAPFSVNVLQSAYCVQLCSLPSAGLSVTSQKDLDDSSIESPLKEILNLLIRLI